MSLTVHIYYAGKNGNASKFAREMTERGIVDRIRAEKGNERYEYFISLGDPETVLLIDSWTDQTALDRHVLAFLERAFAVGRTIEGTVADQQVLGAVEGTFLVKGFLFDDVHKMIPPPFVFAAARPDSPDSRCGAVRDGRGRAAFCDGAPAVQKLFHRSLAAAGISEVLDDGLFTGFANHRVIAS